MKQWITGMMAGLLALILLCLGGCTTLDKLFGNPEGKAAAKVVVQVAVYNLLTAHPEYRQPILDITKSVNDYVSGDPEARVDSIMRIVDEKIRWDKLSPNDALAIQAVMALVETRLYEKINDKTVPADVKITVSTLIGWIDAVAKSGTGPLRQQSSADKPVETSYPALAYAETHAAPGSLSPRHALAYHGKRALAKCAAFLAARHSRSSTYGLALA